MNYDLLRMIMIFSVPISGNEP